MDERNQRLQSVVPRYLATLMGAKFGKQFTLTITNNQVLFIMFSAANRLSIFVDGNNMFYAQQKNGWFFDPRRVLEYFTKEPQLMLINAFWYTGLKDSQDQRGFRDALISLGYTVRTKILKEYYDDTSGRYSQKANLDIEIVVDMFNTVDQYNRVVLFSGDGDFERAIELLRSKNTHITVISTEGMIARELRNVTDRYIDLNDIRDRIEKIDSP
jgi:uncharacterized LabA/DUF88 family protein